MNLPWNEALQAVVQHPLFFVVLTLGVYQLALALYERFRLMLLQPLMISMLVLVCSILLLDIDYEDYRQGVLLMSLLLGPTTVALAVPLYLNIRRIRQVLWPALITLTLAGTLATVLGVALAWLFGARELIQMSMAPKSVTTPIAMLVAEQIGGAASLAAVFVMITGLLGAIFGIELLRLFRIRSAAAQGMAMGIVSHAVGTSRALQESEETGAFSALAMSIMGVVTAVLLPLIMAAIS